jgi:PleD family two-component response regulator
MEKKNSILITDDDSLNLLELNRILKDDYKVYAVKDGVSAVEKAKESLPCLIILDIVMPDMSGFEVFEELQKFDATKNIPVVFITGNIAGETESEGLALGAADYIRKPFVPAVVQHRIRSQIRIINLNRDLKNKIRTPMNEIKSITDKLLKEKDLSSEVAADLNQVHSSCDVVLGIIDELSKQT